MDVGDSRIGFAVNKAGLTLAIPSGYILRTKLKEDVGKVLKQAVEKGASEIVVGIPLSLNGHVGPQAKKTIRFVNVLKQQTDLPITMVNEQYSTKEATQLMQRSGMTPSKNRGALDAAAAAVILQDYLDQKARLGNRRSSVG